MQHYTEDELKNLLGAVGSHVQVHRSVVFINPKHIFIGSHVRIDCFCYLSAGIEGIHLHNYIHLSVSTHLFGTSAKILVEDYCNLASRVSLFTSNDDYKEGYMTNPMVPATYKKLQTGPITLRKHTIVGCGSIIMPDIEIGVGGSVGALSLVKTSVDPFTIVGGIPAKQIGRRDQKLLQLEQDFKNSINIGLE